MGCAELAAEVAPASEGVPGRGRECGRECCEGLKPGGLLARVVALVLEAGGEALALVLEPAAVVLEALDALALGLELGGRGLEALDGGAVLGLKPGGADLRRGELALGEGELLDEVEGGGKGVAVAIGRGARRGRSRPGCGCGARWGAVVAAAVGRGEAFEGADGDAVPDGAGCDAE